MGMTLHVYVCLFMYVVYIHARHCACHRPCWSTDRLLIHFDGYFRLNAGICSVTSNMLESSGTRFACRKRPVGLRVLYDA